MSDVQIPISGDMQPMYQNENNSQDKTSTGFEIPHLPQLPLGQFGYPKAQEWIQLRRTNIRPWSTFLNSNNFRFPASLPRLSKRIVKNIEYFQSNYLFVFIGLILYCLITSPLLLLAIVAFLVLCYKVSQRYAKQELVLWNRRPTLAQVYTVIGICSLPIFYIVGAGSVLFWVLGVSWFVILAHASAYNVDSILCPGEDELNSLVMENV